MDQLMHKKFQRKKTFADKLQNQDQLQDQI